MKKLRKGALLLTFILIALITTGCQDKNKSEYEEAQALMTKGLYIEASEKFNALGDYEDSSSLSTYCKGIAAGKNGDYDSAISILKSLGNFKDSPKRIEDISTKALESKYEKAQALMTKNQYDEAGTIFAELGSFNDSSKLSTYCKGIAAGENGDYESAITTLESLGNYKDCQMRINELSAKAIKSKYEQAQTLMAQDQYEEAGHIFAELGSYEESSKLSMYCKAAATGEKGDYSKAFSTFEMLGDYKESALMIDYYKAREQETKGIKENDNDELLKAIEEYERIELFRDSTERIE